MNNIVINNFLSLSKYKLSLFFLLLLLINTLFIKYIFFVFGLPELETPKYFINFDIDSIIILILFAPVIEVLFFQYLIYILVNKLKIYKLYYIIFSAVLFSIAHDYNISYIIKAFISGLLYASLFYIIANRNKKSIEIALLFTILTHSVHNMFGIFYDYFMIKF